MSLNSSADEGRLPEIGESLRRARAERGITIEQAAEHTRISAAFLRALEAEAFDQLPAPVYVRGFLRSYATYLGLDYEPLLAELGRQREGRIAGPDAFVPGPAAPTPRPSRDPFRREARRPGGVVPFRRETDPSGVQDVEQPEAPAAEPEEGWEWDDRPAAARYTPGVLTERSYRYDDGSALRGIALVAAGVIAVAFVAFAAYVLAMGGDDDGGLPLDNPTAIPTDGAGGGQTVIPVGSPTPSPGPGATSSPGSGDETPTPGPGQTATPDDSTPSATATTPAAGEPTTAPTPTSTPTATPTPSPTPIPPTPTPTAVPTQAPPASPQLCSAREGGGYECGPPYRVICVPSTPAHWFFDPQGQYDPPPYNWVFIGEFPSQGAALTAGKAWAANGCSPP